MDGYASNATDNQDEINLQKYMHIQELYQNQQNIDKEISTLSLEIQKLPEMPRSMENWVSSFSSEFKLSDMKKIFNLNKRYKTLIENRKENGQKIKLFAIDNLIDQINETVKNEDKPAKANIQ
jgi:hypothetical protein